MTCVSPIGHSRIDRRAFFAGCVGALSAPFGRRVASAAPLRELTLYGPPAGPSITAAHAVASGLFSNLAEKVAFRTWRNPDEMRAGLTSGAMPLVIMPTTTAANLFTRGLGVRLVNVLTDGLLHVVAADPALTSFAALRGKRLAAPFRNDTPEFVLNRLLRHHRMEAGRDILVETTGTPIEAIQLLLAGRLDAALVPEPAASAAIVRAAALGRAIHRVMDVQKEWAAMTGLAPSLPQAGLAVIDSFRAANGPLVEAAHGALAIAAARSRAEPARAAADAAEPLELPRPVIEASIPHSHLVATRAAAARPALEAMFTTIADANPAIIGGRLPDAAFYL